tara:strand:- start:729 stop:1604 length:876 start_codon:yes stop_codon:yes gene_type:complete
MISGYEYLQTFHKTSATTYESFDIGCSSKNRAKIHVKNCNNASINAFVIINPRNEYLQNLYHAMEEVFSLYQTANILKIDLKLTKLVFVNPISIRPRYIELFKLVAQTVNVQKSIPVKLCYVEPLRACSGSYLPVTWSPISARVDFMSLDIANYILRDIQSQPKKQVLLMTRITAKSRRLLQKHFLMQCLKTTQFEVRIFENLQAYTMKQQIELVANSYGIIGPHGAGLTLGMFLPAHGVVVEILDQKNRSFRSVNNIYRNIAYLTNHRHYYLRSHETKCTRLQSAFHLNI